MFARSLSERRHRARMTEGEWHPHIDHVGDCQISFLAAGLIEHRVRRGLKRQDRLAIDRPVEVCEQPLGMNEKKTGQFGFITTAGTLADHRLHGVEAMRFIQRNGILRQCHQPHRKLHGIAVQAARQSFAVPALVKLAQIFADLIGKTDPLSDPTRHLAMAGQNRHPDLHGLGKAPLDRFGQSRGSRVREVAGNGADNRFGQFGFVADVDALKVAPQCDLVTERRCQQMCIGIAADVTQQGLVIDAAARFGIEAGDFGKTHRQHAGSQREIARMPGSEIGRVSQRHQKVGTPHRCRHPPPHRDTAVMLA